jgi:hypothetical protein
MSGLAQYLVDEAGAVTVSFLAEVVAGTRDLVPSGHDAGTKLALSRDQVEVLELADVQRALAELMVSSGRSDRTKFRDQIIAPLLGAGLLEMTVPDKPRSPKQQSSSTAPRPPASLRYRPRGGRDGPSPCLCRLNKTPRALSTSLGVSRFVRACESAIAELFTPGTPPNPPFSRP